jgi:riboflavin synthase
MFTGIVEELGQVERLTHREEAARLTVRASKVLQDCAPGASLAVSGVCLTVIDVDVASFTADVMPETLRRSSLGALRSGSKVNLERPVSVDGRLGGHIVQGHVDGTGRLVSREPGASWDVVTIELPDVLAPYVVGKGSITVEGVSLTVMALDDRQGCFSVSLIPATLATTTLGAAQPGDMLNLEVDVLAKYVERLLNHHGGAKRGDRLSAAL